VHLDSAVCFADQAIFGNEISLCDTLFLELFHYLLLNFCLLALSFRSQKSDADSVAAARPSFPARWPFKGHPFQENNHKNPLKPRPSMRPIMEGNFSRSAGSMV
jgi:hypothetical protein